MKKFKKAVLCVVLLLSVFLLFTACEPPTGPGDPEDELIAVTGVSLSQTNLTMEVGGSSRLTALVEPTDAENKAVSWTSSAPNIATVSPEGLVTALAAGRSTITVETEDGGFKAEATVNVVPTMYIVEFNSEPGSSVPSQRVVEGERVEKPDDPYRENYIFEAWYSDQSLTTLWDFDTDVVTQDMTLFAQWSEALNSYTVHFESDGDHSYNSQTVLEGGHVDVPTIVPREGYLFEGWFSDEALTDAWDFDTDVVTQDMTLYAKWSEALNTYTVHFESNGGYPYEDQIVLEGNPVDIPAYVPRDNYYFEGWFSNEALTDAWDFDTDVVTSDLTLYAKWVVRCTIIYELTESGNSDVYDFAAAGSLLNPPEDPVWNASETYARYAFAGWYSDESLQNQWDFADDVVTQDMTLYPKWEAYQYRVSYRRPYSNTNYYYAFVDVGATAPVPDDPTREGYQFDGWYEDQGLTTEWDFENNVITRATVIYAKWIQTACEIYLVAYLSGQFDFIELGGPYLVDIGEIYNEPPMPVLDGYDFGGWYTSNDFSIPWDFSQPISEDMCWPDGSMEITIYAKFGYTITFDANGGIGSMEPQVLAKDNGYGGYSENLRANSFFRSGWSFAGWSEDPEAETAQYDDQEDIALESNDITLYAVWDSWYTYTTSGAEATITGFSDAWHHSYSDILIPDEIDGNEVTAITSHAFSSEDLDQITIGETVELIELNAFGNCTAINMAPDNTVYSSVDGALFTKNRTELLFCPVNKAGSLVLPDVTNRISGGAFPANSQLQSITFGSGFTSIDMTLFNGLENLESINVVIANPNYSSIDGVLFNKSQNLLLRFPRGKSAVQGGENNTYIVPASVETIGEGAFSQSLYLETLTLGAGVRTISARAFNFCENLVNLFPNMNLETIGHEAFFGCSALYEIEFFDSLRMIATSAFQECSSLYRILLGTAIEEFGDFAFYNCSSLRYVYIKAENPPRLGEDSFENNDFSRVFYVRDIFFENYMNASGWFFFYARDDIRRNVW